MNFSEPFTGLRKILPGVSGHYVMHLRLANAIQYAKLTLTYIPLLVPIFYVAYYLLCDLAKVVTLSKSTALRMCVQPMRITTSKTFGMCSGTIAVSHGTTPRFSTMPHILLMGTFNKMVRTNANPVRYVTRSIEYIAFMAYEHTMAYGTTLKNIRHTMGLNKLPIDTKHTVAVARWFRLPKPATAGTRVLINEGPEALCIIPEGDIVKLHREGSFLGAIPGLLTATPGLISGIIS